MPHSQLVFAIACCGAVGAVLRYWLSSWANAAFSGTFPMGTLLVNLIGCCLLGVLSQAAELNPQLSPTWKAGIGVGLLGALTTFSTFGAETLERLQAGQSTMAAANVLANVVIGLFAVWVGGAIARAWLG